jgi:hypothetical protein
MSRFPLVLIGFLVAVGCGDSGGGGIESDRTVFVEVTSSPSGLAMDVSVGFIDPVAFEGQTPIVRNVRASTSCNLGPSRCALFAIASVKSGDPTGKRVTMCLTDAGERHCETSNDGTVTVSATVEVD